MGPDFRSRFFGARFSERRFSPTYGARLLAPFFGAIFLGPDLVPLFWPRFLGPILRAQFSELILGARFRLNFRDPSHSHLWGSIFEADYLDPLLEFDFWDTIRWTPGTPWSDLGARLVRPCCDLCAPSGAPWWNLGARLEHPGAPRCSPGYSFLALSVTPSATPVRPGSPLDTLFRSLV